MNIHEVRTAVRSLLESTANANLDHVLVEAEQHGWPSVVASADAATAARLIEMLVAAYRQQQQVSTLVAETYEGLLLAVAEQCERELDAMDVAMSVEIEPAYALRKVNWLPAVLAGLGGYVVGRHGSSK